jgi:GNAT superfamily N-acetyltransferase
MNHNNALREALMPLGLSHRLFRGEEDLQANVDLNNVCARADGEEWVDTMEVARRWLEQYEYDKGDPRTDMIFVETTGAGNDNALAAKGLTWWWKNEAGEWLYGLGGWVHSDWRRKGIGRAVLRWTEGRAREMAAAHERNGAPAYLTAWTSDQVEGKAALLTSEGYEAIRHGYTMLRDLGEPIPDMPLPEGVEVRPVQEAHIRQIWEAMREAFRDHWGYTEWTDNDYRQWREWPDFNSNLWQIAWQGDEVAGGCVNDIPVKDNETLGLKRGWLEQVAVRRPWRKMGVAKTTIARSLRLFKDIGLTEGALGVDAQNPNGALQLYEGLGFRVHKSGTSYRKALHEERHDNH